MNEDLFIKKVMKLEEDVADIRENMATKDDVRGIKNTLDYLVKLYERGDQERTLLNHDLKRVEEDVARIKVQLKMA